MCRLRLDLATRAQPILEDLSNRAGANAHLAKLDGAEVFDLLRVEHPAPLRITRNPMLRRPAPCTALGKAILAFDNPTSGGSHECVVPDYAVDGGSGTGFCAAGAGCRVAFVQGTGGGLRTT